MRRAFWRGRAKAKKRCRYDDCHEGHPVATDNERVTCATCREWLGLPPIEDEGRTA